MTKNTPKLMKLGEGLLDLPYGRHHSCKVILMLLNKESHKKNCIHCSIKMTQHRDHSTLHTCPLCITKETIVSTSTCICLS